MRIVTLSDQQPGLLSDSVVTIGNFDGVHRGHRALFRRLTECGSQKGLLPVAVTFEPHPLMVLAPEAAPRMLTTREQKLSLIAAAGIECCVIIPFDRCFAAVDADRFVVDWLCGTLGMRHIVIGHDYAFGRERQGDYRTLERLGAEHGFSVEYMDQVGDGDVIFSSSMVRSLLAQGDMAGAARILGRYHHVSGTVIHGHGRGQGLGYPTANIATSNELMPPDGVYAVMARIGGRLVTGAANIGLNPTFANRQRTLEVFLLDFTEEVYGQEIAVWFVSRLRGEQKFGSAGELSAAIGTDVTAAREAVAGIDRDLLEPAEVVGCQ